mgnify:CR=1 FL=1
MAVLVTGGAGYIGSHMVLALRDRGEQVVVLDNLSTGFREALAPGAILIEGDVGDRALVLALIKKHGIEAIIHFAAKIVVPDSVADPLGYYLNNTVKTREMIAAAVEGGVGQMIFSSTAAVYGNPQATPVAEDAALMPLSPYGTSKMMSEMMLRDAAIAHPLRYVVLRYFNVAGADPGGRSGQSTPNATHLIKVAVQTALGMRPSMQVFGDDYATPDGTCVRDYIHVSDLIGAHAAALAHLRRGGASDVFNCGYGHGYSVLEVIDAVKRLSGVDFKVDLAPPRAGDPGSIIADATRIRHKLAWMPEHNSLETIVRSALAWERHLLNRQS